MRLRLPFLAAFRIGEIDAACRVRRCAAGRDLDPCLRRGDGGRGHTGILQACGRMRKRRFSTSAQAGIQQASGPLLAQGKRGQGSHRNPVGLRPHEETAFFNVCASRNPAGLRADAAYGVVQPHAELELGDPRTPETALETRPRSSSSSAAPRVEPPNPG